MERKNPFVYLDFTFNGVKAGRVVIEVFKHVVPKAAENFRSLCTGEKGDGIRGKPLHYKGTKIHRVVTQCMVQGGDIISGDGSGGESIYGDYFEDENFDIKHVDEGCVGMSNDGPNKNSSQFYITTAPCTHLDGTNVVIGKVVKGLDIIKEMAEIPSFNDIPLQDIIISRCGEFKPNEPWNIEENDGTPDIYPPWPNDWDKSDDEEVIKTVVADINSSGNIFFYKQNYLDAERKYKKVIRYIDWYLAKYRCKRSHGFQELRNNALLNLTAVRLKIDKNKEALEHCNEIIKQNPNNGKAYYRRARAKLGLKDFDGAIYDLKIAYTLHPNDRNIKNMFEITKNKKLTYLKTEKKFCLRLFK